MKKISNQTGSAILTTLFLLFGIIALGFVGIEIMLSGFSSYMNQEASTQAYFAAEAGVERALSLQKIYGLANNGTSFYHTVCSGGGYVDFANSTCTPLSTTWFAIPAIDGMVFKKDEPQYQVRVNFATATGSGTNTGRIIRLNSRGSFLTTARELEVSFCLPQCQGQNAGDSDGCGGVCL